MGKGQELYNYAKKVIPGGTQLLSKRPEQFLPDHWPAYYSRAEGCQIWDLDFNEYTDVSFMGIGACVLGYAFPHVDTAVKTAIDKGSMSTLNAPEEVFLAEKLLSLHHWADMIRYAKAGGEATAQAVRIARAATGKDKILFCGYHGWHDWYLSANILESDSLDEHLLSGLDPAGVPKGLKGTAIPFRYNDIDEFRRLCDQHGDDLAAVVMEPVRNDPPYKGFLDDIREYTQQKGIVLIFDEITAGFRLTCGGSHLTFKVNPDIAIFGKALGNGYPITAIIGRKEVMTAAQDTFMSSTFWTERTGFAAALAMIDFYLKHNLEHHLIDIGIMVQEGWKQIAQSNGLTVEVGGIAPLSHFTFKDGDPLVYKTYFTQEMLKMGYLATTSFYASYAHKKETVQRYLEASDKVFKKIASSPDLSKELDGPVCHSGFQRLI